MPSSWSPPYPANLREHEQCHSCGLRQLRPLERTHLHHRRSVAGSARNPPLSVTRESCRIHHRRESRHDVHITSASSLLQKWKIIGDLLRVIGIQSWSVQQLKIAEVLRFCCSRHSLRSAPSPTMRSDLQKRQCLRQRSQPWRHRSRNRLLWKQRSQRGASADNCILRLVVTPCWIFFHASTWTLASAVLPVTLGWSLQLQHPHTSRQQPSIWSRGRTWLAEILGDFVELLHDAPPRLRLVSDDQTFRTILRNLNSSDGREPPPSITDKGKVTTVQKRVEGKSRRFKSLALTNNSQFQ